VTTTPHPASEDPARDERFLQGIAGAGIGIWDLDLSNQKLLWSGITRTLFGVSNEPPVTTNCSFPSLKPKTASVPNAP